MGWRILKTGILKTGSYEQERTKRGMCKSGGINLTGNGFWSDKVSVSFVVRSDRDLAFVTISVSKKSGIGLCECDWRDTIYHICLFTSNKDVVLPSEWWFHNALTPATKLVRSLTVSERRRGTWVVYVEARDARLEWANGVSWWFWLFSWIGMMGSDIAMCDVAKTSCQA